MIVDSNTPGQLYKYKIMGVGGKVIQSGEYRGNGGSKRIMASEHVMKFFSTILIEAIGEAEQVVTKCNYIVLGDEEPGGME